MSLDTGLRLNAGFGSSLLNTVLLSQARYSFAYSTPPPCGAESAGPAAPVNLDQGPMRYEPELIYVASHDMLAGSDTHLGGWEGECVCVCVDGSFLWQKWMEQAAGLTLAAALPRIRLFFFFGLRRLVKSVR